MRLKPITDKPWQPRILNAEDDAREQVAADLVGAEPMFSRRRQIGPATRSCGSNGVIQGASSGDNGDDRHADNADAFKPSGTPEEIAPVEPRPAGSVSRLGLLVIVRLPRMRGSASPR